MPGLSKRARRVWSIFIGDNGRRQYNPLCRRCCYECKQSFRVTICVCRRYEGTKKGA